MALWDAGQRGGMLEHVVVWHSVVQQDRGLHYEVRQSPPWAGYSQMCCSVAQHGTAPCAMGLDGGAAAAEELKLPVLPT